MVKIKQVPVVLMLTDKQVGWLSVEPFNVEDTFVKVFDSPISVPITFVGKRGWIVPCSGFEMLKYLYDTGKFEALK